MKKLIIMFALLLGVVSVKAQSNDLYQGITKKLPYWNRKRQRKRWRISVRDWVRAFPLRKVPGSRSQWILQGA